MEDLPDYIAHRLKVWDEWEKKQPHIEPKPISITLPDGKVLEGVAGETTPLSIAKGISSGLARATISSKVNGVMYDCWRPLEEDCSLELVKFDSDEGKHVFWHSSAHVLGQALEKTYNARLCIGPALDEGGFYYEASLEDDKKISEKTDLGEIEGEMKRVAKEAQPFQRLSIPKEAALDMFKFNKYKQTIISSKIADGTNCTVYRCGPLIDLCRGPHLPNTSLVKAVKVNKASSSYFLGDAKNDSLQRVYALSYPTPKLLKVELHRRAEAAKRDHRLIGQAQELFFFSNVSPGSCFWLPHGTRIYNTLQKFLRDEYRRRGFQEVKTPNVFKSSLWETSGHWAHYKDDMFTFECEKEQYGIKPMNCPSHCEIFGHRTRSWRELPLRMADFGALHRNEISGALTGLTRVRRFQQDDGHIFCRKDQINDEICNALGFLDHVYGTFGFEFALELSTKPKKAMGDDALWELAEAQLKSVLDEYCSSKGMSWKENPGDGAFYGPKIDIKVYDALKRRHQCATIQLDFQLPERFDLKYQAPEEGKLERPIIIHRAIFGSFERFIAILIEHTGGKWPFWVSPRQIRVLTITQDEAQVKYAEKVVEDFKAAGYFAAADVSDKKINRKVRDAQLAQVNYILCIGNKEVEEGTVDVRTRDNKRHGTKPVEELLETFASLVKEHK